MCELMLQKQIDHSVLRYFWEQFLQLDPEPSSNANMPEKSTIGIVSPQIKASIKLIAMAARYVNTNKFPPLCNFFLKLIATYSVLTLSNIPVMSSVVTSLGWQNCRSLPSYIFSIEPSLITANLEHLIRCGLGSYAKNDFQFARDVCFALQKLTAIKVNYLSI